MRFVLCLSVALVIAGCQSSLPGVGAKLAPPSPGETASNVTQPAPSEAGGGSSAATPTAPPEPTETPTVSPSPVPSPTETPSPIWPMNAPELVRGNTSQPYVALTLDAGAGAEFTPAILNILREKNLRATVFLTGKWVEENPALAQQIVADGHEMGNHSYDHPDFTTIKAAQMTEQITRTEEIIHKVTGMSTRPLFRYPYGARDAHTETVVNGLGYRSIYWTLDSLDWREETTPDFEQKRVLTNVGDGDVLVFHLNAAPTAKALGSIIDQIRAKGFELVKVSQLPR